MERLLVIVVTRIGDTLLVTPAIRALAATYPEAVITVLVHPTRRELLLNLPFVHRLSSITKRQAFFRGRFDFLRDKKPYDAAIVYGHDVSLVAYALRVADKVVAQPQRSPSFQAAGERLVTVADPKELEHAVPARLRMAQALGAVPAGLHLSYVVTAVEQAEALQLLAALFRENITAERDNRRWVGIQLQSFPTKAYRDWPHESFVQLLQKLLVAAPDVRVVVLGDHASTHVAQDLVKRFPARVASLAGRITLRQAAAVMSHLSLYIGVDTGPTHLAGALGIPMVALYHCMHRGCYLMPLERPSVTVIEHPAADGECSNQRSMAEISVDQVWQAVQERLGLMTVGQQSA